MIDYQKKLKIAFIGTRGVPAQYGGFETCVEEVGQRLAKKGHQINVYCRKSYYQENKKQYKGMKLIVLPNIQKKALDTIVHTFISVIHAIFRGNDIFMVFNCANSFVVSPLWLIRKKIVINTDGLEWKRSKWGKLAKAFYRISERIASKIATRLISDSRGIKEYYKKVHSVNSTEIAYGAYTQVCDTSKKLEEMGLTKYKYFLQITRFEPENSPLLTIQAFKELDTDLKLVIVGGSPYDTGYCKEILKNRNQQIILPGFIYEQETLKELWCSCYAYIHGNEVGGTNPALLQAMASGNFVIASDVNFNRDVLSDAGIYFKKTVDCLKEKMAWAIENETQLNTFKNKAVSIIERKYNWDDVAVQYENLFYNVVSGRIHRNSD